MRRWLVPAVFALAACVTNDFAVVDALRLGMTPDEARQTIAAYGFEREHVESRPADGWAESTDTFVQLSDRARSFEGQLQMQIRTAEAYPVSHGILGFGILYLFYGDDGKLIKFYRRNIN